MNQTAFHNHASLHLGLLLVLVSSGGASCRPWQRAADPLSPVVFSGPPTLENVIYAVNANSANVRQLSSESASLSTPGAPSLRATLAVERPTRLRLRGKLIGQELDLGSNDELFWFWAKSDPERSVYYAYHQQFTASAANQVLPVGPDWIIDALGLVNMEPTGLHEGPHARPDGSLEVRTRLDRNGQPFTRLLVLDGQRGWILEQQILDAAGRPLAIARNGNHRFYPEANVSLPHRVHIELPPAQLSFQLDVGRYAVNQPSGDPAQVFAIPQYDGYQLVNIAESQPLVSQPAYPPSAYRAQSPVAPHTAYRLRYRGFTNLGSGTARAVR